MQLLRQQIASIDDRRDIVVPGDAHETVLYAANHFISLAESSISSHGHFAVALSGGSTPKAIFKLLTSPEFRHRISWKDLLLFWSDERCVSPDNPESNYHMAMEAGFASLPIPKQNIFRMQGEAEDIENAARQYEKDIHKHVPHGSFDLVMLGMGDDGHTASLFPKTHGLHTDEQLVTANFIPQKNTWRLSLTYPCINDSHHIAIYVIGKSKASMLKRIFTSSYEPDTLPIQRIGTRHHKALFIVDNEAAAEL